MSDLSVWLCCCELCEECTYSHVTDDTACARQRPELVSHSMMEGSTVYLCLWLLALARLLLLTVTTNCCYCDHHNTQIQLSAHLR